MVEKNESPKNASLREFHEEIGIKSKSVKIIGELTPIYIPISNFTVYPFVGWIDKEPNITLQKKKFHKYFLYQLKI